MRGFKLFAVGLVPAVKKGVSSAYDGLKITDGAFIGQNGGHVAKYSKFNFKTILLCSQMERSSSRSSDINCLLVCNSLFW